MMLFQSALALVYAVFSTVVIAGGSPSLLQCPPAKIDTHTHDQSKPVLHGLKGDVLNVTRCYCEAPTFDKWGYYLQADYANYHTGLTFQVNYTCNDNTRSLPDIPTCWNEKSRLDVVIGPDVDEMENQFSYRINAQADCYYFNSQIRKLGDTLPNARPAPDMCDAYCNEYLHGMHAARDNLDVWTKTVLVTKGRDEGEYTTICNRKEVFNNLSDMCWNCKKKEE